MSDTLIPYSAIKNYIWPYVSVAWPLYLESLLPCFFENSTRCLISDIYYCVNIYNLMDSMSSYSSLSPPLNFLVPLNSLVTPQPISLWMLRLFLYDPPAFNFSAILTSSANQWSRGSILNFPNITHIYAIRFIFISVPVSDKNLSDRQCGKV